MARTRALVSLLGLLAGCDSVWGLERPPDPPPVPGEWASVTSGLLHACAIQTDGSLWCWGESEYGRLGLGPGIDLEITRPQRVGAAAWTTVGGGNEHTCGIRDDQTLWCWGNNTNGQLGDTTRLRRDEPVQIGTEKWKALGVGEFTTCAIRADDSLWCWGLNIVGQVGDGTTTERTEPTLVDATRTWTSVSVARAHSCALTADHQIWCWGAGPFPPSSVPNHPTPVRLEPAVEWTAVQTMFGVTCGITVGEVRCWGTNDAGQLGDGTTIDRAIAAPIASARTDFVRLASRTRTACAFTPDDAMVCWGENRHGQLGSDTAAPIQTSPYEADGAWKRYAPGLMHACAIDGNAHLVCTGGNSRGQRGDGAGGSVLAPVAIPGRWTAVAASEVHTCAISRDTQRSSCWGANDSGQLGDGTVLARQVPTQVSLIANATQLAVGRRHTCEVTSADGLQCWGENRDFQLATSLTPFAPSPVRVLDAQITNPTAVAAFDQSCAIGAGGRALCWGRNDFGQLGRGLAGASTAVIAPVVDAGNMAPVFSTLTAGDGFTCGTSSASVYCWGANGRGQLGVLDTTPRLRATSLAAVATSLDAGKSHACLVSPSDALYCWGDNTNGQLGLGPGQDMRTDPAPIGAKVWRSVSAGESHTCAIKSDNSLWCWGRNARGALGTGTRTSTDEPVTRIGTASWKSVTAGADYTCGIQADDTMWCWGVADWGQLGTGTAWSSRWVEIAVP